MFNMFNMFKKYKLYNEYKKNNLFFIFIGNPKKNNSNIELINVLYY